MLRCYVGVISFLLLPLMVPTWSFSKSLNATLVKPVANAIFPEQNRAEVFLGQLLFYDPILSGNKTVACATCHHPKFATSDGVSLGLGDGGIGLGPARRPDPNNLPEQRIPRHSPALFNLGATEFVTMFHDGRLQTDPTQKSGIRTPLSADMVDGFVSVLSAQAMFPVLSPDEMAGHYSENLVAKRVRQGRITGEGGAWEILAARVSAVKEYRTAFDEIIGNRPIHFTDIANVIAAFIAFEWRADNSPFDRLLRHGEALNDEAMRGYDLFYGKAGCGVCHSGQFQTDHDFHAIALPQIGPGKAERFEQHQRDEGRMRVTGVSQDAFAFRTPSLRNVTHTAPYGHAGAYATLEAVIRHHLDPQMALRSFDPQQAILPPLSTTDDFAILQSATEMAMIADANVLGPISLTDAEIDALIAFLASLTDQQALQGRLGIPEHLPSGLVRH